MDFRFVHGTLDPASDPHGYAEIRRRGPTAIAIGKFDGVHLGHRALMERLLLEARRVGCQAGVVTFDRPPAQVLCGLPPVQLTTLLDRQLLCAQAGLDFMLALKSTPSLFGTGADAFATALVAALNARVIVVGANFRFGRGARGDVDSLRSVASPLGVEVIGIALEEVCGHKVSSTRIREELAAGHVDGVAQLLGRPFSLPGTVGDRTALGLSVDLEPSTATPALGVYLARIAFAGAPSRGGRVVAKVVAEAGGLKRLRLLSLHGGLEAATPSRPCTVVFERSAHRSDEALSSIAPAH
jgi:riboflavin kinase/FMN adenylyltransferase